MFYITFVFLKCNLKTEKFAMVPENAENSRNVKCYDTVSFECRIFTNLFLSIQKSFLMTQGLYKKDCNFFLNNNFQVNRFSRDEEQHLKYFSN